MKINIAFASDNGYVQHMGCCIASILANSRAEEQLHFYILDGGISEENKNRVEKLRQISPCEIEWLKPDMNLLKGCPIISHFSINTYLRLLLPEMLPNVDRLIYMDCDMIVTSSLAELWTTDLQGRSLGVVSEFLEYTQDENYQRYKRDLNYEVTFNAGMLLMDMTRLHESQKFRTALQWTIENAERIACADQDALNTVFADDCLYLPFRWNIQIRPQYVMKCLPFVKDEEVKRTLAESVGIIHYLSGEKPWHYLYYEPQRGFYWKYLQLTEWKDYRPERPKFKQRLKYFKSTNPYYQAYRRFRLRVKRYFFPEKKNA
ncbi:MAG: glycosyltransferase family 8 protein [Planctomycetia bacterium]|nr:glycosyltransferase family 8 protein [Planctomycetia bacterium]